MRNVRGCFYVDSAASDWVARLPYVGRQYRTQSPLFSGLDGHFKSRIPSKGGSPSMFQSDFPSGPGAVLFKAARGVGLMAELRVCARPLISFSDPTYTHH